MLDGFTALLVPGYAPFLVALGVVAALLLIELAMLMVGGSVLGGGDVGVEIDVAPELDAEVELGAAVALADGSDIEGPEIEGPEFEAPEAAAGAGGLAGLLGWGEAPTSIWIAATTTAFGVLGVAGQSAAAAALGAPAPAWAAALAALAPAALVGGRIARVVARIAPNVTTEAVSRRRLGGRLGVMGVGVARRGNPAQARVRDRFGNIHHIRVEPFDDADALRQGDEVAILRAPGGAGYRAMRLTDARDRVAKHSQNTGA